MGYFSTLFDYENTILLNKLFQLEDGFALQFCVVYPVENSKESNGQNIGGREALKSRGEWSRREVLPPGGRQDRVVLGVATLDRSPAQSPGPGCSKAD